MAFAALLCLISLFTVLNASAYISKDFDDGDVVFPKPAGTILPRHCSNFDAACRAEAEERYEDAFQIYESKYEECGSHGWNITGGAGGSTSFVIFKTTPCGLHVALKKSSDPKECNILKLMTSRKSEAVCPGCFPEYYYFSNSTNACYSELIHPIAPLSRVLPIKSSTLAGNPARLR